jgi:hypothetical protein
MARVPRPSTATSSTRSTSWRVAGQTVETAVVIDELARWPLVPPHWIYLHSNVTFASTNTQPCPMPGWLGHSRQIVGWGNDPDPVAGWVAHVRGVVGEAR